MKCHYCGKEVWLVRHLLDGDFCSPAHRKKYNERLRRALDQLPVEDGPPAPIAEFQCVLPPADSQLAGSQRSFGFQPSLKWPCLPQTGLKLSPLFGQTFFGPNAAIAAGTLGANWPRVLPEPVAATALRITSLGAGCTTAIQPILAAGERLLPVGAVSCDSGAPALPLCSVPAVLKQRAGRMVYPRLAITAVLADTLSGDAALPAVEAQVAIQFVRANLKAITLAGPASAVPRPGNTEALPRSLRVVTATNGFAPAQGPAPHCASWVRPCPETLAANGSDSALPRPLADAGPLPARRRIASQFPIRLRLVPLVLPMAGSPLLAESAIARGRTSLADFETAPLAVAPTVQLHAAAGGVRPSPAREIDAIWKIAPAAPWTSAPAASAEPLAAAPMATALPRLALVPVPPGLAAEHDVRSVEALPVQIAAAASPSQLGEMDAATRSAVLPGISVSEMAAALPDAREPRLPGTDVVSPQERAAVPAAGGELPVAAEAHPRTGLLAQKLAPCLETWVAPRATPGAVPRMRAGEPIPPEMPAFIPQAAVPRTQGSIVAGGILATPKALPGASTAGFAWSGFAGVGPQTAELESRPVVPEPVAVNPAQLSLRQSAVSVTGISLPLRAGTIPLDVYLQRVRSSSRREVAWRPLPSTSLAQPAAMPGLWPARFEQQVLQDWRRRHPGRQAAVTPAPVASKAKVLPITGQLGALERLRRNASHFIKGAAAAAMISAIAWLSWSSRGVQGKLVTDRQWLRNAIAQRASLVLDDNFRSGLNLWEGRKNWNRSWAYSPDGFVRTGQLALYRPTMNMQNYRLEFFAQIESKSVGWVFRAKDERNYYAMKLSVTEPGPRPLVSVVRYPVTAGLKGKRVQIPLPIMMHNNTPYHVALDVKGSRFRAFVEDQEVDSWNDDRLRAGGVGFFSEAGEHARLYWVKVSHNTDWLGRLCGMISGGKGPDQASDLWDPATENGTVAALDPGAILNAAKNVDRKRGAPMLPFAAVFLGSSL